MIKILENIFAGRNALGNMLVKKFSFSPMEAKLHIVFQFPMDWSSHIVSQFMDVLFRVIHTNTKLTVRDSDTFKRFINVDTNTCWVPAFPMNTTDHINVVHPKSSHSLMSRLTAPQQYCYCHIVNSDAYQQSSLLDKWESMSHE